MYVPAQEATAFSEKFDPNSFSHCWCNKTLTEIGMDDDLVTFTKCSTPERRCYKVS
jgi:hypothetical protein